MISQGLQQHEATLSVFFQAITLVQMDTETQIALVRGYMTDRGFYAQLMELLKRLRALRQQQPLANEI